jgi:hypothetical protein
MIGTMAMTGDGAAATETVAEQTGQMWDADGVFVRSEQKWNCAPRKITARSKPQKRDLLVMADT